MNVSDVYALMGIGGLGSASMADSVGIGFGRWRVSASASVLTPQGVGIGFGVGCRYTSPHSTLPTRRLAYKVSCPSHLAQDLG